MNSSFNALTWILPYGPSFTYTLFVINVDRNQPILFMSVSRRVNEKAGKIEHI